MKYLVVIARTENYDPAYGAAHQEFLAPMKTSGELFMSGKFVSPDGGGAYVLNTDSLAAARKIAAADPMVSSGSCSFTVQEWNATLY